MTDISNKKITPTAVGVAAFVIIIAAIPGITFSILQLGFPATIWTILVYVLANLVIGSILENNPGTHWIAVMLGSKGDAHSALEA